MEPVDLTEYDEAASETEEMETDAETDAETGTGAGAVRPPPPPPPPEDFSFKVQICEDTVIVRVAAGMLHPARSIVQPARIDLCTPLQPLLAKALEDKGAFPEDPYLMPVLMRIEPETEGLCKLFAENSRVFFYRRDVTGAPCCRVESGTGSEVSCFPCENLAGVVYFAHPDDPPAIRVLMQPVLATDLI